ncbi:MAG: hypothetical protein IKW79_07610 [Schwartzia sp.]|nr:hypothetical protein [Schwartzia sp. (in: firmicutes)]
MVKDSSKKKSENNRLEKQVRELSARCKMQEKVLAVSGCSTLQLLLDQFLIYSKTQLVHIVQEARYTEFDPDTAVALCRFREYLFSVYTQLGEFTSFPDKIVHSEMGRIQDKYIAIGKDLERLRGLSENTNEAFSEELDRLQEYILQMVEENRQSCEGEEDDR